MTDLFVAPINSSTSCSFENKIENNFYTVYLNGEYTHLKEGEVDAVLLGTPHLSYNDKQDIKSLLTDSIKKLNKKEYNNIIVHGFCTLLIMAKDKLLIYTDTDGYRTAYYTRYKNKFYLSSKIHHFQLIPGFKPEFDQQSLPFTLVYGFQEGSSTIVDNVKKSSAGELFILGEEIKQETIKSKILGKNNKHDSLNESIDKLYDSMMASLSSYKSVDSKVAILLGGFDSALIAAMAVKAGFEVETFSFYYQDQKYNQGKIDELVKLYKIKHNWIPITHEIVKHGLTNYSIRYSIPSNWPHYIIQSDHLCRIIKDRGYKLVFTGDGCDGLFQGYPQLYRSAKISNENTRISKLVSFCKVFLDYEFVEKHLGHTYRLMMRLYRNSLMKNPEKTYLMYRISDERSVSRLTKIDYLKIYNDINNSVKNVANKLEGHSYTKLAYMGRSNMGPNRTKINGIIDTTGLLVFSPYMHWLVKELVNSMPETYFRPEGKASLDDIGKFILIKMTEKYNLLSDEIIHQPKMAAVDAPMDDWYESELKEFALSTMENTNFVTNMSFAESLVKKKIAEKIYRKYFSADAITSHFLSLILTISSYSNSKNK